MESGDLAVLKHIYPSFQLGLVVLLDKPTTDGVYSITVTAGTVVLFLHFSSKSDGFFSRILLPDGTTGRVFHQNLKKLQ